MTTTDYVKRVGIVQCLCYMVHLSVWEHVYEVHMLTYKHDTKYRQL